MIDRYTLSPLREIWSDEYRFQAMLNVEIAVCEAWSKKGKINNDDLRNIKQKAKIDISDIRKREEESKHETIAFVESITNKVGKSSRYLHYGITSSDILDTAQSLQIIKSLEVILKDTKILRKVLFTKAKKYKKQIMMGRTHGVHAEPITLGLKFLLWVYEIDRDIERLEMSLKNISYGKISGSVGTYAHVDPYVEKFVCKKLKLKYAKVSSQILQRDRYCDVLYSISTVGNTLEKIAFEIRHLHRTEIGELKEPFEDGQKGSSSMPHKKNPILCERICGLARVLRGNLIVGMENTSLWGERDMSHSSAERFIIPDSLCTVHFMLNDMSFVLRNLKVNSEKMRENINLEKDNYLSQTLMLYLVSKGMEKRKAYKLIQKISFDNENDIIASLLSHKGILKYTNEKELNRLCNLDYYTRYVDEIFRRFDR